MPASVTPAVVPPTRWVMWAIAVFLFLIGFFHRAAPGGVGLVTLAATAHGRNIYDQLRAPTAREAA